MANVIPTTLFPGYTSDGTNITIPITSLSNLSAAEADAATGDGRALVYGILDTVEKNVSALAPGAQPTKMSNVRGAVQNISSGSGKIVVRETFTTTFEKEYTGNDGELAAEA